MLKLKDSGQFKKDYKRCEKRGLDMEILKAVVATLAIPKPLEPILFFVVAVIVAVPFFFAFTIPFLSTDNIFLSEDFHVTFFDVFTPLLNDTFRSNVSPTRIVALL